MKTSQSGIDLIKSFEGLRLKSYKALTSEKYYTIGYGHYGETNPNRTITKEEAESILISDLSKYEKNVNYINERGGYNFNQNEFDALVSFAYNIGSINQLTNYGKRTRDEIRAKIPLYNKANGYVLSGLTKRRAKELELFNTPVTSKYTEDTTIREIVDDVIDGKFGNGEIRERNIYSVIQDFVNKRFS